MNIKLELTTSKIRGLKGAPLSCLVLLALSTTRVSQEWLERQSGYTDKPVSQALAYLSEEGYISQSSSGWALAEGFQLPLGLNLGDDLSRKNSDSDLIIITTSACEVESVNNNNNRDASRKNSDSYPVIDPELSEWLGQGSIYLNDRTRAMLALPHVTAAYVKAKVLEYRAKNLGGPQWAGLLIKAIEKNEPAPALAENGHLADCECGDCAVRRFRDGGFDAVRMRR